MNKKRQKKNKIKRENKFERDSNELANSQKTIKLTDGSDIDEIVGDGKIKEFMDYIERIDNSAHTSDKLQFKEFMESSKRQRYPSYNYEANKDNELLKDYSVVLNGNDSVKIMQNDIEIRNTKRTKNNRKPNMFALPKLIKETTIDNNEDQYERNIFKPIIRITSTEDERIEYFLHENGDDTLNNVNFSKDEILIKSKTTQLFGCEENANEIFKFDEQSDAVFDNNRSIFEIDERRLFLSELSSDSNQIDFKAPSDTKYSNRKDSSGSKKSNIFYERSESRLSDLEYIRGRDDWKNHYGRYEIGEEIDSDNYHHLRRHSEADDTLEYVRGRDDWVKNQSLKRYGRRTSLPKIFEGGEHKIVIQDEIDSDEYHHNLIWNDKFRSASESMSPAKLFESNVLTKLKPDNAIQNSKDFVEISNTEINDVIENIIKSDTTNSEDIEITVLNLASDVILSIDDQKNIFEPFIIISETIDDERELFMDVNANRETRDSHYSRIQNERTTPTIDSNSLNIKTTMGYSMNESQNEIISLAENKFDNSLNKKESNMNVQTEIRLKMKNEGASDSPKTKQKLKVENIEDLIRDVSLGPWFHK